MAKGKKFREWVEEDYPNDDVEKKKDSKRYDKRKSDIQRARRQKRSHKESCFKNCQAA
jgi:hypothetical protein